MTMIGWIILIRGTILLCLSQDATARLVDWFHFEEFFYLYLGFAAVLGLYLAAHGFSADATKGSFVGNIARPQQASVGWLLSWTCSTACGFDRINRVHIR